VIRLARGGGSAGNHGIESIFACIGHRDFQRLRIGVGPDPGGAIRAHFVLSKIADQDLPLFEKVMNVTIDAYEEILKNGIQSAMNKYNGMDFRPPEENAKQI
jgi:PTH1 family peptidyl-tRNA hydrolase